MVDHHRRDDKGLPEWGPRVARADKPIFGGALPFGMPSENASGYSAGPGVSNYADGKLAQHVATGPQPQSFGPQTKYDTGGATCNLEYAVAHGSLDGAPKGPKPMFILAKDAGTGEADGIYKPANRKWEGSDVYANRYGDCIISREAHKNAKTGETKHGFVLGKDGSPLYGVKCQKLEVPTKGWKAFQGMEPVPEIQVFDTWADCCQNGAWYFAQEASNASEGGHWKVVLLMADRAFDCHTLARPKGRGDVRNGGIEWAAQLCDLLGTRADALLHLGQYKKSLVDACAAVHFVPSFDWTKAQTRGVTACLNMGVEEDQAKLLMAEFSRRTDREFPGIKDLDPIVDEFLEKARRRELQGVTLPSNETPDDGRIYFKVVDSECKLYARPSFDTKVIGTRSFNDIVRGRALTKKDTWLELHVSEAYDDSRGEKCAYIPLFTEDSIEELDVEDREEMLERLPPRSYPRPTTWEKLGLNVTPLGLKPPSDTEVPFSHSRWKDPERDKNAKPWPYIYKHGLALATMLRGAPIVVIDSFIRYHWGIGFNHIFLFFDDPGDPAIEVAKEFEALVKEKQVKGYSLSIHPMDAAWWEEARCKSRYYLRRDKSDMFETVCKLVDKQGDVESKQVVAFDIAIMKAHEMGIDWFAHVDIDECIYVPEMLENSARRFLGAQPRSVECVRLFNHEAVPEKQECENWFRDCTLFQMNRSLCYGFKPAREYDSILRKREGKEFEPEPANAENKWFDKVMARIHVKRQAAAKAIRVRLPGKGKPVSLDSTELPSGMEASKMHETFFHFIAYDCGKSIVRLDSHFQPALPLGLHGFLQDNGDLFKEYKHSTDAVILHYPNASFSHWMQKYEQLGGVPSTRNGQPNPMRFHLASSEVVLHREKRDQELFYKTFVMQNESSELATLAEYGVVQRVEGVRKLLEWLDEEHEAPEQLPGQVKWFAPNGIQFGK